MVDSITWVFAKTLACTPLSCLFSTGLMLNTYSAVIAFLHGSNPNRYTWDCSLDITSSIFRFDHVLRTKWSMSSAWIIIQVSFFFFQNHIRFKSLYHKLRLQHVPLCVKSGNSCYRPQTKFAKVMFSQVSVCPRGGGVCPIACWDTHPQQVPPGRYTPRTDTPPPFIRAKAKAIFLFDLCPSLSLLNVNMQLDYV